MRLLLIGSSTVHLRNTAIVIAVLSILVAPFTWSHLTKLNSNPDVALATAGTNRNHRNSPTIPDFNMNARIETSLDLLLKNTDPDNYLQATQNAMEAAPYILATNRAVLTFGGFKGSDDIIDLQEFTDMVENEEIQYVLGMPTQKPEIAQWMRHNCSIVNPNTGETIPGFISNTGNNSGNPQDGRTQLYDCGIS